MLLFQVGDNANFGKFAMRHCSYQGKRPGLDLLQGSIGAVVRVADNGDQDEPVRSLNTVTAP
jgi:hypothetical protein